MTAESLAVVAVVPTAGRPDRLSAALASIAKQTCPPTMTIIVGERPEDWQGVAGPGGARFGAIFLRNRRAANVSGAMNTALEHLVSTVTDFERTYVAFLDDDDTWEPTYLDSMLTRARDRDLDFVYSGIIRHEEPGDEGRRQSIPQTLTISDFLATNPHVQGSNMVVRLSSLLRAGGFDEHLPSTTDRDLCIRLLDLGDLRHGAVPEHIVHHWATYHPRLSSPGSARKAEGLQAFFDKYGPRMTVVERTQFLERSRTLFDWEPGTDSPPRAHAQGDSLPDGDGPVELMIGFTATWIESAQCLLHDILTFVPRVGGIARLVVCDNTGKPGALAELVEPLRKAGIPVRLVTSEEISQDADRGRFSSYYVPQSRRSGIAYGRTVLHHCLYRESEGLRHAVFWVLDDDVRIDRILYGDRGEALTPEDFLALLCGLKADRCDVAVGGIFGDPPVPAANLVRTQLVDLLYNLRGLGNLEHTYSAEESAATRDELKRAFPDYYYDLSVRHFGHLETPFPLPVPAEPSRRAELLDDLLENAPRIAGGIGVLRPLEPGPAYALKGLSGIPVRGGNTLVLDRECLKTYPNVAPRLGDVDCRRGDTVWCILNARIGGLKVHRRTKQVRAVALWIRQERRGFDPASLTLKPVMADIFGGAFMRAIDEAVSRRVQSLPKGALPRDVLRFSDAEIEGILASFGELVSRRLTLFRTNAWRIRGLVGTIRHLLLQAPPWGDDVAEVLKKHRTSIRHLLDSLDHTFSPEAERSVVVKVSAWPREELEQFLRDLPAIRSSYSEGLPVIPDAEDVDAAVTFLRDRLGVSDATVLGEGNEALVLTDGTQTYKYFYHGTAHFVQGKIERLRETFSPDRGWRHVTPIEQVVVEDNRVVFVRKLVEGEPYRGGHLNDLVELLRECRRQGVVLTNLAPRNLVVGPQGLTYVDLGISVDPFEDHSFRVMCKRAYLVYRWHFRKDLKDLLTRSIREDDLPELFGLEHLLAALDPKTVGEVLHPPLLNLIERLGVRELFDYGCGDGHLAAKIAAGGVSVTAYDVDRSALPTEPIPGVSFLDSSELWRVLDEGRTFPHVLASLVLCTIEDDREVQSALENLRRLVAPEGRVIVGVCNPFSMGTRESETHLREGAADRRYRQTFAYREIAKPGTDLRVDVHRPFSKYLRMCRLAGLEVEDILETFGTDVEALCPDSDFLILVLRPLAMPPQRDISLLIKASAMEWKTIGMQVRHIVGQLEGPQRFVEKVVATDDYLGPFVRQYDEPNWDAFVRELEALRQDGVIDRFIVAPRDEHRVRETFRRWFGIEVGDPRSENGQPTHTTLFGIEQCRAEYVLQLDSDCLIGRTDRDHDYLGDLLRVFEEDPYAVTVSLPILYEGPRAFVPSDRKGKWRTEVRCSMLSRSRLLRILPIPNEVTQNGKLGLPWHRALDNVLALGQWQSYRGGDPRTFFIHVPNERKGDVNRWYNILKAVEAGRLAKGQVGSTDLVGGLEDWLVPRDEGLVFLVRGQNVPLPRLRRCVESLLRQQDRAWGAVFVDAASDNGMEEYLDYVLSRRFRGSMTLYRNLTPAAPIENMHIAIRQLCKDPDSIIVTVDADDALPRTDVVAIVKDAHTRGADVTVGSMIATDKERRYPVRFANARGTRGGNVWQHLRTFRKRLFDQIPEDYLKVDGKWVPFAEDWAFMLPIVEAAEHPTHLEEPLYFYEPSPEKAARPREAREAMIAAIVSKPPLRG